MSNKQNRAPKGDPPGGGQQKLADARKHTAQGEQDSFQPHNAKKEGLGPNTKR